MNPPSVTPESVAALEGLKPVLWLEELDKFNATKTRLDYLLRLINAVYENNGTIVATANMTKTDLREHLGTAIFRRSSGDYDTDGKYQIWGSHVSVRPKAKRT